MDLTLLDNEKREEAIATTREFIRNYKKTVSLASNICTLRLFFEASTSTCSSFYSFGFDPSEALILYACFKVSSDPRITTVIYKCEESRYQTVKFWYKLLPCPFDFILKSRNGNHVHDYDNILVLSEINDSDGDDMKMVARGLPDKTFADIRVAIERSWEYIPKTIVFGTLKLNLCTLNDIESDDTIVIPSATSELPKSPELLEFIKRNGIVKIMTPALFMFAMARKIKVRTTFCTQDSVKFLTSMDSIIISKSIKNITPCLTHLIRYNSGIKIVVV